MSVRLVSPYLKPVSRLLMGGVAIVALSACASSGTSPMTTGSIGGAVSAPAGKQGEALSKLAALYKKNPNDKATIVYYAAALRANGQAEQAVAVFETGIAKYPNDVDVLINYAKALSASGRLDQAMNIIDRAIDPAVPNWNALLVKGAILDQQGKNGEARRIYATGLKIAPQEPSLRANLGLSYMMTNELDKAEAELRIAVKLPGASTQVRQNLALVVGLQGRFDEARTMLAAELPAAQVEANMEYIRSMLTQQNRWDLVKAEG
ncbi:MAG: tetratricopeptide repeat protein [Devosia sp.]